MKILLVVLMLSVSFIAESKSFSSPKSQVITDKKGYFVGRISQSGIITDKRGYFVGRVKSTK